MRCSRCGLDNQPGMKFCGECAAPLPNPCPQCGFENPPAHKFCGQCAAALPAPSVNIKDDRTWADRPIEPQAADVLSGERKTVTALFADIKGSMELMEDLDPEEARAIVDPALRLMIDAVHRYDGYIVQSTGDGIFALFGAPVAHEDHPQRALYAALRIQEELRRYSGRLRAQGGVPIEARIGANTGEVVVRSIHTDQEHAEYTPIGHTTNLASRMQVVAPTGSIAVSEATRKLVEGYFLLKALGPTLVKGLAEPVNVYEVTGIGPLRTRLEVASRRGLTKFVGRQAELEQMKHALDLARQGHGQIVAAMGDPGVGKSRLFFEFKASVQSGCLLLEAYSVSHGKASAYLPVIDLLKSYFEIMPEDDERKRREKVAGKVVILDRALEDTLPYLYALLGINESEDPMAALDPQTRRRRTLEAIKRILVRESLSQPLIVEFEDLHWIDTETQALLNLVVDGLATARILLLVNYRPEYHHQWGSKTFYTQLRLDPLGKRSAEDMLDALLGIPASPASAAEAADANRERPGADIHVGERARVADDPAALKRLVIDRTEGNPFFMEEMVQALFEQGALIRNGAVKLTRPLEELRVPPTVQAILASRIDRLPAAEKDLLQTLAVLGREFPSGLIKRVTGKPDDEVERMLAALQVAEFIYEQPATDDVEYTFKHALTLEVAYNSMLTERRRVLHERAGQAIEALFSDRLEDHLSELAHHYDRSGNFGKAIEYLSRAGQRAVEQSAHSEAVACFDRALELSPRLPDGDDRSRRELDIAIALAWSLYIAQGPQAPERERSLTRARELAVRLRDDAKLTEVELALALFRFNQRDFHHAREMAEGVADRARQASAPAMLAGAEAIIGAVMATGGEPQAALDHLEGALAFFGTGPFRNFGDQLYAQIASGIRLMTLIMLGYPTAGIAASREMLASARRRGDPVSMGYALLRLANLHCWLRDSQAALEHADELLSLATEEGMEWVHAGALAFRGQALAMVGHTEEGIEQMRLGVAKWSAPGANALPTLFASFAEMLARCGKREEGLAAVTEGLARAAQTGGRMAEPELCRVKGELAMINPPDEFEAEQCFRIAAQIARGQSARWWELRAIVSLARLLKRQGKTEEARTQLAEIYNWFTEGFEFADLKDAKALLEELEA